MNDQTMKPPGTGEPDAGQDGPVPRVPAAPVAGGTPAGGSGAGAPGGITALIAEYEKAVKWNSFVRVVFPLFVLAVIVVFLLVTAMGIMAAFPEKRVTTETVKAGEELVPILNKVVRSFVDEVAPQLAEEFERGLVKGTEKLAVKLGEEIEKLEKNTHQFVKDKVRAAVAAEAKDHEKLLLEVFPGLKDDPQRQALLTGRLNKAFEMWTVHYLLSVLEDYYIAMSKINDTVTRHFRAAPGKEAGPGVQESEMLELFMELLNAAYAEQLTGEPKPPAPPAAAAPAPAPAGGAAPAPAEPEEAPAPPPAAEGEASTAPANPNE